MDRQSREELLLRLRSIEGHIRGIQRMLEDERSCVDVVRQTLAVKRALDGVSRLLIARHLCSCFEGQVDGEPAGPGQVAVEELLEVLELTGRL